MPDEHLELLQNSEFTFLHEILAKATEAANQVTPKDTKRKSMINRKPTLGSIFKHSLISLMDTIGSTNVHYIRCIKPNEAKVAWEFEPPMVLAQLRACGVLETIRISCLGYPSRWTYEEFADRYYALVSSQHWDPKANPDVRELCQVILDACITDTDKYQVGETKIFFLAGQLAYLEKMRSDRFDACATVLQKNMRRFVYRHRYLRMKEMAVKLQCLARVLIAKKQLSQLKQEKAAITIQKYYRRFSARKQYLQKRELIVKLQALVRGHKARQAYQQLRENKAAIQIQRHVRGMLARTWYKTQVQRVVFLQSCVRRRAARKQLLQLKAEAKSANHFKEVSYKLENKVVELTQAVTTLKSDKQGLAKTAAQLESQIQHWQDKYTKLEQESKLEQGNHISRSEFDALKTTLDTITAERDGLRDKNAHLESTLEQLQRDLAAEKEKTSNITKPTTADAAENEQVADLKSQIIALKAQLAKSMHTRQGSLPPIKQNSSNRNMSPSASSRRQFSRMALDDEAQDSIKPLGNNSQHSLTNRKLRRNSSAEVTGNMPKTSIDQIRKAEALGSRNPRPTSVGQSNTIAGGKSGRLDVISDNPEEEINAILRQEEPLLEEVLEGLVKSLKLPLPSEKNAPSHKEVMFPAHLISMCVNDMWRIGYNRESENLLFSVMDTITKQCLGFVGEDAVIPCAFWLTNVHELLSLAVQSENRIEAEMEARGHSIGWREFEKLLQNIKYELQCLEDNIYHTWMKEIKKKYSKMVIAAVIESQSLPGFITNDSGRFFNKLLLGSTGPAYSMDDLLNFLNKVYRTMNCYFMEQSIVNQVLTEILKMTGVMAFNDLLMRKNFSSWKRGKRIHLICVVVCIN